LAFEAVEAGGGFGLSQFGNLRVWAIEAHKRMVGVGSPKANMRN